MGKPQRRFGRNLKPKPFGWLRWSDAKGDRHGPRRRPFDAAALARQAP
jgi:hypothetical protein